MHTIEQLLGMTADERAALKSRLDTELESRTPGISEFAQLTARVMAYGVEKKIISNKQAFELMSLAADVWIVTKLPDDEPTLEGGDSSEADRGQSF